MIRVFDVLVSGFGLLIACPIIILSLLLIYLTDRNPPVYIAKRVGLNGHEFKMYKLRTMVVNADAIGGSSTATEDSRVTFVGKWLRRFKLDELTQLMNVLTGDMSLVGPRPNVNEGGVSLYTSKEKRILSARPGITDLSSIVFADEGDILKGERNPDLTYNQLIRPWKSRLALLYIDNKSLALNLRIIYYTIIGIVSREKSLQGVNKILISLNAEKEMVNVSLRMHRLKPFPPPGLSDIVSIEDIDS